MHRLIKLPVIAALVTVLSVHLHSLPITPAPTVPRDATPTCTTSSKPPSSDVMREYMSILRTLGTLVQRSGDLELQRARELCMMLYTKVETGLRIKWLHKHVGSEECFMGATQDAQPAAAGTELRL
jgi:hypothetical protein